MTWFGYAVDEVPELARGIGGVQKPQLSSPREGASFPVGRLDVEDRAKIPMPKARPLVLRAEFQEEELFKDVLGMTERVDELLREASTKGDGVAPVFVDASQGEGAYQLKGRYRIQGDAVEMTVKVFRGEREPRADFGAGHEGSACWSSAVGGCGSQQDPQAIGEAAMDTRQMVR